MTKFSDVEGDSQNDSVDAGTLMLCQHSVDTPTLDVGVLNDGISESFNMSQSLLEETPSKNGYVDEGMS